MIVEPETCPDCQTPVIRSILHGRDLLVELVPHPEGDLELYGMRTLRKPIAVPVRVASPTLFDPRLYRPHKLSCAAQAEPSSAS